MVCRTSTPPPPLLNRLYCSIFGGDPRPRQPCGAVLTYRPSPPPCGTVLTYRPPSQPSGVVATRSNEAPSLLAAVIPSAPRLNIADKLFGTVSFLFSTVEEGFVLSRNEKTQETLTAPNSITLKYKRKDTDLEILFNVKGSRIELAMSQAMKSQYHFGIILQGNDYTVKNCRTGKSASTKHFMLFHLIPGQIEVAVCRSREECKEKLGAVWGDVSKRFAFRSLGRSVLSVKLISQFLNREKSNNVEYVYRGMKLAAEEMSLVRLFGKERLKGYTNCFLFCIRFIELLNHSSRQKSQLPKGSNIVMWFGEKKWKDSDLFERMWDHAIKTCENGVTTNSKIRQLTY